MTLLALSRFDDSAVSSNRYTGGLDMELFSDLATGSVFDRARPEVKYALPAKALRSTVQTARERCWETIAEFASGAKFAFDTQSQMRLIDAAWQNAETVQNDRPVPAWLALVNDPAAESTPTAVYETISAVFAALDEQDGLKAIDVGLKLVHADVANPHHLVALLRTLSRMKGELTAWTGLRDAVFTALSKQKDELGIDPAAVLDGLYDDE